VVECVERRDPYGIPRDVIDDEGAIAVFAFKGEMEQAGPIDYMYQLVILVFGEDKALYYRQEVVKGLGWDVLYYSKCYEDSVERIIDMLRFYMRKAEEGVYELIDKRIMPGYESLFKDRAPPQDHN